jgi:hypothetical protein
MNEKDIHLLFRFGRENIGVEWGPKLGNRCHLLRRLLPFEWESEVEWGTNFESDVGGARDNDMCGLDDVGGNLGMETVLNVTVRCT